MKLSKKFPFLIHLIIKWTIYIFRFDKPNQMSTQLDLIDEGDSIFDDGYRYPMV